LLKSAEEHRFELGRMPDEQPTDSDRTMEFMGRERHDLHIERIEIDWDFSERLDRIGVDGNACGFAQRGQFAYRLENTGLVVG
jgi:hypothetical protein